MMLAASSRRIVRSGLKQKPRRFSFQTQNPPKGAEGGEKARWSPMPTLVLAMNLAVGIYVYNDPDVLPPVIRNLLPIKETKKAMTPEEYDAWRESQRGYATDIHLPKVDTKIGFSDKEESLVDKSKDEPVKSGKEMRASLEKLLKDIRESEASFKAQLKQVKAAESRRNETPEEMQQLQMYKEEILRIQNQIKFVKKMH